MLDSCDYALVLVVSPQGVLEIKSMPVLSRAGCYLVA